MIDLETYAGAATIDLGAPEKKSTSVEGDQEEASKVLFVSTDGSVEIGVWACTAGKFTADRSASSEICHIISGRARFVRADGDVREVGPGDVLVLPRGWKGVWTLLEATRKLYVIHRDPV